MKKAVRCKPSNKCILNDITGPMADKALFLAGGVKFFREDYKEADHFFSQLVEQHPNSTMAPQAVELAIISKASAPAAPTTTAARLPKHESWSTLLCGTIRN